jgi:hypothetical protein
MSFTTTGANIFGREDTMWLRQMLLVTSSCILGKAEPKATVHTLIMVVVAVTEQTFNCQAALSN